MLVMEFCTLSVQTNAIKCCWNVDGFPRLTDNQMSGILADDMGLGKTVQTLSLLAFLAESRQQRGVQGMLVCVLMVSTHM